MKIGIIGAMEVEVARLVQSMTGAKEVTKAGMHFYDGKIGGTDAVVVRCGIGKVNAGLCVQILCDLFDVTHLINTGIAGSLEEEINISVIRPKRRGSKRCQELSVQRWKGRRSPMRRI